VEPSFSLERKSAKPLSTGRLTAQNPGDSADVAESGLEDHVQEVNQTTQPVELPEAFTNIIFVLGKETETKCVHFAHLFAFIKVDPVQVRDEMWFCAKALNMSALSKAKERCVLDFPLKLITVTFRWAICFALK
jgi:hypothetical protein